MSTFRPTPVLHLHLFGRLTAIREMGLNPDQLTKAFGKRATPGLLTLFQDDRLERLPQGLGDYAGTALENAQEHANTFANVLKKQIALYSELQAEMAVGATSVRKTDTAVANFFVRNLNKLPPIVQRAAGSVLEVTSQAGRLTSGILDLSMGLFGLQQITGRRFGVGPKMFAGTQAGFARTNVSWLKMFAQANAGLTALSVRMRTAFAAGGMGAPGAGLRPGAPMPPGARMGGAQRSFAVAPYGAGMGGPGAYGQQPYAGPATRAARGPGAAGAAGMMAAAATMTYLNYELINLVKGVVWPQSASAGKRDTSLITAGSGLGISSTRCWGYTWHRQSRQQRLPPNRLLPPVAELIHHRPPQPPRQHQRREPRQCCQSRTLTLARW